ncbi:MAG: DNA mismatch repair endonuclease MutL, partial [Bacillota bacterium]|nr:DNA mismatch repair endonuclease MutL [Bacillota bacterium]
MNRINVLDSATSNKIAAGEVVERPFSVVKELVENSIDAGAKNIIIEINDGGQTCIKITDDGHGIHPDDIEKAFLPHATSKILNIDDIFNISTLGFRGEALASIAAISNTTLISRNEQFDYGRKIIINGGKIESVSEAGANIGTIIEVKDLFFNVPARLKFLKSPHREAALIGDIVHRLAIANPSISFKLISNGKVSVNTYGTDDFINTVRYIYGKDICDNIIPIEKHEDLASVTGYIGKPEISRGSRNNQSVFVNKRYIKNKMISTAVEAAFKSFLTINKYPFFILFIDIYPEFIDVNVHPTKTEIKFKDERLIFKLVFDAVHDAIKEGIKVSFDFEDDKSVEKVETVQIPLDLKGDNYNSLEEKNKEFDNRFIEQKSLVNTDENYKNIDVNSAALDIVKEDPVKNIINKNNDVTEIKNIAKFEPLNVLGQFNKTYILAEGREDLYIIDQHAAHEKILFEKYINEINNAQVIAQLLISPVVLELDYDDFSCYINNKDIFLKSGFNIEIFGENTISIREVPVVLGKIYIKELFLNILDNLKQFGTGKTTEVKYNNIAKMACKAAVKAND